MKSHLLILNMAIFLFSAACSTENKTQKNETKIQIATATTIASQVPATATTIASQVPATSESYNDFTTSIPSPVASLINKNGTTVKERFLLPEGFERINSPKGSFAEYLQSLPLKPDGSKVHYFDGREKSRDVYLAVVDYTLGKRDLQQCADSVIRLRAEYLYATGQKDKIAFKFVDGFNAKFSKWASGYGISVNGDNVLWVINSKNNDSYESLQKYLDVVYAYSSTLSLDEELLKKDINDLSIGDVFIRGGSPGHTVIVIDMAVNKSTGKKIFMIAQSYMPAQDIQILKSSDESSPWYFADIKDRLITPEWIFEISQLKTWTQ